MLCIDDLKMKFKLQLLKLFWEDIRYSYLAVPSWSRLNNLAEDFALHAIAALINHWYQKESEKRQSIKVPQVVFGQPLNAHLKKLNDDMDQSEVRLFQRNSKRLRDINERLREEHRKQGYSVPDTYRPSSAREGILLSNANFQTILNFSYSEKEILLFKSIESGRIKYANSVPSSNFAKYFVEYEEFVNEVNYNLPDKDYLDRAIDFYACQRKLHIDLIAEIAKYMDTHNIKEFPLERSHLFWSVLNTGTRLIEANQVYSYNEAIPIVFSDNLDYLENELFLWTMLRFEQSDLTRREYNAGFEKELTVELAVNFFRNHYNLFKHRTVTDFGTPENPNQRRIKLARKIMAKVYPNPKPKTPSEQN